MSCGETCSFHSHLDHYQILLQLAGEKDLALGTRPFRFHASWLLHRDFPNLVDKEWKQEGNFHQN